MNGKQRPLDSGRTDSLGRTIKVAAGVGESRADAPAPLDEPPVMSPSGMQGALLAERMLGWPDLEKRDVHELAGDAIGNLMHLVRREGGDPFEALGDGERHFEAEDGEGDDLSGDSWTTDRVVELQAERDAARSPLSRGELVDLLRRVEGMSDAEFDAGGAREAIAAMGRVDDGYSEAVSGQLESSFAELSKIGLKPVGVLGMNDGWPMVVLDTPVGKLAMRRSDYGDYSEVEFRDAHDPTKKWVSQDDMFEQLGFEQEAVDAFDDASWTFGCRAADLIQSGESERMDVVDGWLKRLGES